MKIVLKTWSGAFDLSAFPFSSNQQPLHLAGIFAKGVGDVVNRHHIFTEEDNASQFLYFGCYKCYIRIVNYLLVFKSDGFPFGERGSP